MILPFCFGGSGGTRTHGVFRNGLKARAIRRYGN